MSEGNSLQIKLSQSMEVTQILNSLQENEQDEHAHAWETTFGGNPKLLSKFLLLCRAVPRLPMEIQLQSVDDDGDGHDTLASLPTAAMIFMKHYEDIIQASRKERHRKRAHFESNLGSTSTPSSKSTIFGAVSAALRAAKDGQQSTVIKTLLNIPTNSSPSPSNSSSETSDFDSPPGSPMHSPMQRPCKRQRADSTFD